MLRDDLALDHRASESGPRGQCGVSRVFPPHGAKPLSGALQVTGSRRPEFSYGPTYRHTLAPGASRAGGR